MTIKSRWLAGALLLVSGVALAQGEPGGAPGHWMNIDKLEVLLELDGYQKQEVQKIFLAQREAMQAHRQAAKDAATRPAREEMRAHREAARQETREKLAKVLSETQLKKFDVLTERPPMRRAGERRTRDQNR